MAGGIAVIAARRAGIPGLVENRLAGLLADESDAADRRWPISSRE